MADYKIQVGVELRTKDIDAEVNKYNKPLELRVIPNMKSLETSLKGYRPVINVNTKLSTKGITEAIKNYKSKDIRVKIDPDFNGIDRKIESHTISTPLKVKVELNWTGVRGQIASPTEDLGKLQLDAELNDEAIGKAIKGYKSTSSIKVDVDPDFDKASAKISGYQMRNMLKVNVKLNKTAIDSQIKNFQTSKHIEVGAKLRDNAIESAVSKYAAKESVPVAVDFIAGSTKEIDQKIQSYRNTPVEVPVKLMPAKTGFSDNVTNKPVKVNAELNPENIDKTINNFTPTSKIKVDVKLIPKDINAQVRQFEKPAESLTVDLELNKAKINEDIALFQPTATLGVKPDLILEDVDDQIRAYVPKAQIKIDAKLNDGSIDAEIGKQSTLTPIQVNVKLDRENINEQIRNFKTQTKIKVGVKLDFASHKDESGKEIQKGIAKQIKDYETKTKVRVGIQLDQSDISQQIGNITTSTPITLGVRLDPTGVQNVQNQISNIRQQIQQLGNITINFGGNPRNRGIGNTTSAFERASREIYNLYKQIESMELKLGKLEMSGIDAGNITAYRNQLNQLRQTYESLLATIGGQNGAINLDLVFTDIDRARTSITELSSAVDNARTKLASDIKINIDNGKLQGEIDKVSQKFNQLGIVNQQVTDDIADLQRLLCNMDESDDIESVTSDYQTFLQLLKSVNNGVDDLQRQINETNRPEIFSAARDSAMQRLNGLFEEGSQAAKVYGARAQELRNELNNVGNVKGVEIVNKKIKNLGTEIKNSGLQTKTLSTRLKEQFSKYSSYLSIASVLMYAEQGLRSMFEQVKLIDSAMTELKKVTDETDASYNQFLDNAATRAKEIGTTIDGLVSSTADFARLGYNFTDSQGLAEAANIYAVVGDEIDSVEDATKSLISTLAAFKDEIGDMSNSEFAMSIVDKMNEVANNYAISSGGIGEALQRSASSMAAANNTLDETIAMITAANEIAQNPQKVGNAMKTISMRIRGAKTELEEAGESTDGMVDSTAKLRQEILALSGIDIMLDSQNFKSTYQIMDELSQKWESLSDIAQASITELVAGKHQGNIMSSLMANFDTAREALETSLNSSGSAMAEHAKWSESLEARLLKLKATWQSLSQSFLQSDFLKLALDGVTALVGGIDKLISTLGTIPTILGGFAIFKGIDKILDTKKTLNLVGGIRSVGDVLNLLGNAFPKAKEGISIFTKAVKGSKGPVGALKGAISGLWTVVSAHPILAVVAVFGTAISYMNKLKQEQEELAQEVNELTSKFREQHDELTKGESAFKSEAARYAELSKGVGRLGENVSLTAEEYSEYQRLVNSIANKIPSLVDGYDSQGNAILSVKNNVQELIRAYEELIRTQNNEVLRSGSKVFQDFKNDVKGTSAYHYFEDGDEVGWQFNTLHMDDLENILRLKNEEVGDYLDSLSSEELGRISSLLGEYGIERDTLGSGKKGYETYREHIIRALNDDRDAVRDVLGRATDDLNAYVSELGAVTEAYFSNVFLKDGEYDHMNETMQNVIKNFVSGLDFDFYGRFLDEENPYKALTEYYDATLKQFDSIGDRNISRIESAFNLQTEFNNGDISYGDFVQGLEDVGQLIDTFKISRELKQQLKLSIGLNEKGLVEEYNTLLNRLTETSKDKIADGNIIGLGVDEAKKFINSLSGEELSIITDIIPKLDANATVEQIQAAIDREMAVRGLFFDLNLEAESTSIEALNTALAESVSAVGLSSDSIKALKARYSDLESEGYNLSAMFEETSNGIHLNRKAVGELERAYAKQKQNDIKEDIEALSKEYNLLTKDIESCNDASERASLYVQRDAILQQINDAATLAAQYDGLTSAYNDWLAAEESGQERDMYEKLIEGLENVDDEISRGWLDDGTIEFLELLTGRDLTTAPIEDLKQAYKDLDKEIGKSGYSIRDFFTVNDDGDSTNTGVYNFLEAIESLGGKYKDVIKKKDGRIVGFDFKVAGGDEAIAEALGISEELVEIMLRAADDAGFVINLEGAWTQLADLKTEAESARDTLISLKKDGLDKLKDFDVNFDLSADGTDLVEEQAKAVELLNKFKKDGKINLSLDGAQEALDIAEYLTIRLDDLTEPRYMQIDASTLDDDLKEPVEKMQEFERLSKEKHLLSLTGDTKGLETVNAEMDEITQYLYGLEDREVKAKLGIEGLSKEEIEEKLEKGEIELAAELNLDIQMSDDLKDMRLMMMNQLGLVSDEEVKLKIGYDVDDSAVDELTPDEQKVAVEFIVENEEEFNELTDEEKELVIDLATDDSSLKALEEHGVEIEAFARIFGVEEVDDLKEKLESLNDEQILVLAEVIGRINVEKLKTAISGLDDKTVEAIAKALGEGDVEGLKSTINGLDDKTVQAIAEALGYSSVEELNTAIDNLNPKTVQAIAEALGIKDVDSLKAAIDRLRDKDVEAVANVTGEDDVDSLKGAIDNLKGKTVTVWAQIKQKASSLWSSLTGGEEGGSGLNGTAHANGTYGRAFKQGDWRTKKTENALVGELGREIVVTPDNRWHTIGDNGAEFVNIPRGSIIFNHKQTEELLSNGKVTSGGGRGRAYASGTAYAHVVGAHGVGGGTGKAKGANQKQQEELAELIAEKAAKATKSTKSTTSTKSNSSSGSGGAMNKVSGSSKKSSGSGSGSSSSSDSAEEFEETLDFIEIAIDRVERAIDQLDTKANSVYRSWSERNSNLTGEISKVRSEINLQQQAYNKYMSAANSVGLSSSWVSKIQNGSIDITTIKDEALAEKIGEYKEYYEAALNCKDAILELQETESELYAQRVENVAAQYEGILGVIEHEKNVLEQYISQSEAQGWLVSAKYYDALASNERDNISQLKREKSAMLAELQTAMQSGTIAKDSEAYYDMVASIDEVTLSITESETALKEYQQTIQELSWETFDILQDRISSVTEEAEFLIELISSDKLFDDKGQLTESGMATIGLHGQSYNTHMYQSDKYATEIADLDKEIAKDQYDQELINRKQELIELQQDAILAAQQEKEAIRDLVEEGIGVQLDALQELIDKKNEALESERDLYEYQKKVKEQTKEIASLEKQLSAYEGDDSEEARQKVQQIKVDLETARQNLQETETDRLIESTATLLDDLYLEAETLLNTRLDNIDALITDVINQINTDATSISTTLSEKADSVGYTLSDSMTTIWDSNSTKINNVITNYGDKFTSAQTTTNNALSTINTNLQNVITQLNSIAKTNVKSASYSSASTSKQANTSATSNRTGTSTATKAFQVGSKVNAKGAKIYDYAGDTSGESQYYKNDPIYKILQTSGSWIQVRWHKLSSGVTGWFKKGDVKAYATGKKNILDDDVAWTQEKGREFIVRPSDGAILTPVAKGDSVLNASASGNIWSMANNPAEFIKENLKLDASNVPNTSNVNNSVIQNFENITFSMPNVHGYNDLLREMQSDPKFEKLILSMTIDQIAGRSKLAKGKSIR